MSQMLFRRTAHGLALVVVLAALSSGCGLIDADVTDFDLSVPPKTFTVDTAHWGLDDIDAFLATDCSQNAGVCSAAAQEACTEGQCFGSCNTTTSTCDLKVLIALSSSVDLVSEKPELETINDQPLVDVEIDAISYQVGENTLNIVTPPLTLYVAPATVMSTGDPQAIAIGTIPPIPAATTVTETQVVITEAGRAALTMYMTSYKTPFNILLGSTVDVTAGDTVPQGRLSSTLRVQAHAGI